MSITPSKTIHVINATNQSMGRLAANAAKILIGKNKVDYQPNKITGDMVKISNINNAKFTGKKFIEKTYLSHSQYPGGLKTVFAKNLSKKQIFLRTVSGMIPKNKLKQKILKRLIIE